MSESQIAYLALASVGGLGALLVIAGVVAKALMKRANDACTATTMGVVVEHRFAGDGRMCPVVQYSVDGTRYRTKKKFRGVKYVHVAGLPIPMRPEAYEDEKGWLHVKTGPVANMRDLAERLWPINSGMVVHYDPTNPRRNYVGRPLAARFEFTMSIVMGLAVMAIGVLVFFLMQL